MSLWTWYRPLDRAWGLCTDEAHAESLRKYPDEFEVTEHVPAEHLQGAVKALGEALDGWQAADSGAPASGDLQRERWARCFATFDSLREQ